MKKSFFALLSTLLLSGNLIGQASNIDEEAKSNLSSYLKNYNREIAYLTFEEGDFLPGNYFAFDIYLAANSNGAKDVSDVVYFDIISPECKPLVFEKIKLENGFASAAVKLPSTLLTGFYSVRAYTYWTKEEEPDFVYERIIKLGNPKIGTPGSIEFYPQYGHLYHGINSLVIKTTSSVKEGVPTSGFVEIFDSKNQSLGSVSTDEQGYGKIDDIVLNRGEKYYAMTNGSSEKWALPEVEKRPKLNFKIDRRVVKNGGTQVEVSILNTGMKSQEFYIAAQQGGLLGVFNKYELASDEQKRLVLSGSSISSGFNEVTILDKNLTELGSKVYYVKDNEKTNATFNYLDYYLSSSFPPSYSKLGVLEDPASVERFIESHSSYSLDYQKIVNSGISNITRKEKGLSVQGMVTLNKKLKRKDSLELSVFVPGTPLNIIKKTIPKSGEFRLDDIHYTDTTALVVSIDGLLAKDFEVTFDEASFQTRFLNNRCMTISESNLDSLYEDLLIVQEDARLLDEVVVKAKKREYSRFYSADIVKKAIDLEDSKEAATASASGSIINYLSIKLPGSQVSRDQMSGTITGFALPGIGATNLSGFSPAMFIYDGVPMTAEAFNTMSPAQIGRIEVLTGASAAVFGSRAGNGVVVAYPPKNPVVWNSRQKANTYYLKDGYLSK